MARTPASSAEEFYAYVTGGKAIPPGIMNDPSYSSLTEVEKANMLVLAQKQSNENLANMLKIQNQQRDMLVGQMQNAITGGAMTQQQLTDFIATTPVSSEQAGQLTKLFGEHNADEVNLGKFGVALQTGGAMFGTDERKGFDVLYARESSKEVGAQNQDYMNSTILPFVGRSGVFPEQLVVDLTNMARGNDPQRAGFAWQNLALMSQQNPSGFARAFGADVASDVEFFRQRSNYYPAPEVMQQMLDSRDPTKKPIREIVQKESDSYVKDNSSYFTATEIMSQLGTDIAVTASDPAQLAALESEFLSVFTTELGRYRNGDEAYEAARARIASKWGSVSYGGQEPYLMRNPPSLAGISPIGGSLDWVDTYARETIGLDSFRLSSDHVTENEVSSGEAPSYLVMEDYGNGVFLPKINEETGLPQRLVLDPPDAKEQSLDAELWFRDAYRLDNFIFTDTAPQDQAALSAASPMILAARQKLLNEKPKYAPVTGTSYENPETNDIYRMPTEPVSTESLDAALTTFGFKSLNEFITFTQSNDMAALLERHK
ncbi:MAG: hypothetical protein HC888_01460 [Candidatus Competibacteraceae bacterium]|nr:hypothetical protein [Candidatus Competibacteraceae bacterium]